MYPLSHIYVSYCTLNEMDAPTALGSVLPDILVGTGILWRKAHRSTEAPFREHLTSPALRLGAVLHGIDLPGLDYFSDIAYQNGRGYAYQKAALIEQDVVALGVHPDHALWRGHNFIEMAIEIRLSQQYPQLWEHLFEAQNGTNLLSQVEKLACALEASHPDRAPLVLQRFLTIQGNEDALAQDYAAKLNNFYSLSLTPADCQAIIGKSLHIIESDYHVFLTHCITAIQQSLAKGLV
ncbi:MAG TPA: hypothetical protein GXX34_02655 [Clostridia bacterium]|nr:hypothetical protein [Clostridia bacterium]